MRVQGRNVAATFLGWTGQGVFSKVATCSITEEETCAAGRVTRSVTDVPYAQRQ